MAEDLEVEDGGAMRAKPDAVKTCRSAASGG
jgi:hypothetical protein